MKGIGTDIVDIARFRNLPYMENRHFYDNIFTENESKYCLGFEDPYPHFAARFAAKESIIKALTEKLDRKMIEIIHKDKKPFVYIDSRERDDIRLSLSHTDEYALSFAVVI